MLWLWLWWSDSMGRWGESRGVAAARATTPTELARLMSGRPFYSRADEPTGDGNTRDVGRLQMLTVTRIGIGTVRGAQTINAPPRLVIVVCLFSACRPHRRALS